jgi:hypothetical protein
VVLKRSVVVTLESAAMKSKATQIEKLASGIHEDAGNAETKVLDLISEAETLLALDRLN